MRRYTLNNRIFPMVMALLMVLTLLLPLIPAASAAQYSGSCGDDLSWELNGDTLVISGSGSIWDYPESTMAPWYELREQIAVIRLPQGLTRIGDLAFYGCTALTSLVIPDSVTEIGWHAFDGCTGLAMLTMSKNVQLLEASAFQNCTALKSVYLPQTLKEIRDQAFYRCESLSVVTVPSSVVRMGVTVFGYCYELVRVDFQAQIDTLPSWTFYGCAKLTDVILSDTVVRADENAFGKCNGLTHVEYSGSEENADQLEEDIDRDVEGDSGADVTDEPVGDSSNGTIVDDSSDDTIVEDTQVSQTENSTVSSELTVVLPGGSIEDSYSELDVTITIENEEGWQEVQDQLDEVFENETPADVEIFIKDDSEIPEDFLESIVGENVNVTVHTGSGTTWYINGEQLFAGTSAGYTFVCHRTDATQAQLEMLGCAAGFELRFLYAAQINAEVMIRLPSGYARSVATFCRVSGEEAVRLQSVVVDDDGYAHFYLGSVDPKITYLVGINMPKLDTEEVLIPENLYNEYGVSQQASNVDYVITGRKSSWGIGFLEVNQLLIGFMLSTAAFVGLLMYALNKRKLRKGYTPGWDDEDDEQEN